GLPWVRRGRTKSRTSAADAAGRAARTGPGPAVLAAAPLALPRPRLPGRDIRRASPDPGASTRVDHRPGGRVGDRTAAGRARHHRRAGPSARHVMEDAVACDPTQVAGPG